MGCPYDGVGRSVSARSAARWAIPLDEAVARVAVVVDAVLSLQVLDVAQVALRVGTGHSITERLERVQERFFEAATHTHALVRGQVGQHGGEAPLESDGHVDALDLER